MKTNIHFWSYLAQSALELETIRTSVVKKIKICILCSIITPPLPQKLFACVIMWKSVVQEDRPEKTIVYGLEKMRFAFQ